ncbi:MAG: NUDIX hydrolase [Anaerolineae bacterium]|jgi:8-oxo-dGTP diphosphatase|nr:NUDIX hydrolase [Anaerolineae bacterium]
MARIPTKHVYSAGGVVYRRDEGGRPQIALIATKGNSIWGLPKGLIDPGERAPTTALREVQEETGLVGRLGPRIQRIEYWYRGEENGQPVRYHKTVTFFLIEAVGGNTAAHDWEVDSVEWLSPEEAAERATYESEREVIRRAGALLAERENEA